MTLLLCLYYYASIHFCTTRSHRLEPVPAVYGQEVRYTLEQVARPSQGFHREIHNCSHSHLWAIYSPQWTFKLHTERPSQIQTRNLPAMRWYLYLKNNSTQVLSYSHIEKLSKTNGQLCWLQKARKVYVNNTIHTQGNSEGVQLIFEYICWINDLKSSYFWQCLSQKQTIFKSFSHVQITQWGAQSHKNLFFSPLNSLTWWSRFGGAVKHLSPHA